MKKDIYAVIVHKDDSCASTSCIGAFDTHEEALKCVLNDYFDGDKEQMDFEQQGEDYWDENCNGVEIISGQQKI